MHSTLRSFVAAFAALGLAAAAGCSRDCRSMQAGGSLFAGFFCGAEGTPAPEPEVPALSLCQPREVMPAFFSLVDDGDPALAGLREVVGDLGRPVCLPPPDRSCTSPLTDLLGVALRAMAAIAKDPVEAPGLPPPGCLGIAEAMELPAQKRSRLCELRRMLDFLIASGGDRLLNDPALHKVLISLMDYIQGKTDGSEHYDLLEPLGRMAAAQTASCDPAAFWTLLDKSLGYLTPATAAAQLGAIRVLLADPYTKQFLAALSQGAGAPGRDAAILLAHALAPAILNAPDGAAAPGAVDRILDQLVYGSASVPQSFKDEIRAVMDGARAMLADSTGIFPPLRSLLACASSPEVRCANPASCTGHDDELIGALYDILSRPESASGVDLATLVGALENLATLDQTGQAGRTLRLIAQGIEGSPDPADPHEARDAVAALAASALTPDEGRKLVPALRVLIDKQVLGEFLGLLHDLYASCSAPPRREAR